MSTSPTPTAANCGVKRRRKFLLKSRTCQNENTFATESLARAETRAVKFLRACMVIVLLVSAVAVSSGLYRFMRNEEQEDFSNNFHENALQLIDAFHEGLERNMGAVASMSTAITSYANDANLSFPFLTLPDFELRGANLRVQSGSNVVVYAPLVTDDTRQDWEDYAQQHRGHIDVAYEKDTMYRLEQDAELEVAKNHSTFRDLEEGPTILEDGTGYHPKIFGDSRDEPVGSGPCLPVWQRSPVEESRQGILNYNVAPLDVLIPDLDSFLYKEQKALFNAASTPAEEGDQWVEDALQVSQFRHKVGKYANDLHSYMVYPVFDSFEDDRQVAGILVTDIFWKNLFRHLLPYTAVGITCVINNSFGQTFSYRVDGPDVIFLGMGDTHDTKYDDREVSQDIFAYIQKNVGAHNRAYKTVGLSNTTQYRISVYPSESTEELYVSDKPLMYALILVAVFTFACAMLITYSYLVERRQVIMMTKVLESARQAAEVERELNEFLAHEVRNPLSAAIAASTHVELSLNETASLSDPETMRIVREDIDVINASCNFINDFLRSMLDIYKATGNRISVEMRPTDLKKDIFDPVASILCKRTAGFQLIVDCPDNLFVRTDPIRLKQCILNLVRNASEFVLKGFVRMRAEVVDHHVILYVEDSGPGVSPEKRGGLFNKYQQSLDLLCQGTGIGLALSKKLMEIMKGDLYLDESYHSGVQGCPGARFVVQLNAPPLDIEASLPFLKDDSDGPREHTHSTATADSDEYSFVRRQLEDVKPESQSHPDSPVPVQVKELPENRSCLFVDDDTMLRKLFMRAIKKVAPSWNVQDASCGEAALLLCDDSASSFDLIFVDQYMASTEKRLLGSETVDAMRKKGVESKICGLSANDVQELFLQSGADCFLMKPLPCKPADLKAALLRILNTSRKR